MSIRNFVHRGVFASALLLILWGGSTAVLAGTGPAAGAVRHDRAVIRTLFTAVLNGGRLEVLNRIISPHYVEHSPVPGQAPGVAGVKAKIEGLRKAFPDMQFTLEAMVAEGNLVAARWYFVGTQTGKFGNIAPTGRRVHMDGIDFYRVENGRITAHWAVEDRLGLLRQLGAIETPH